LGEQSIAQKSTAPKIWATAKLHLRNSFKQIAELVETSPKSKKVCCTCLTNHFSAVATKGQNE